MPGVIAELKPTPVSVPPVGARTSASLKEWEGVKSDTPIVFLSAVRWDDCLSGRTRRMAEVFAARGENVTFVEMPSLRAGWKNFPKLHSTRVDSSGVRITWLPPAPAFTRLHWTGPAQAWLRSARRKLARSIQQISSSRMIVSTPWWAPVLRGLPAGTLCYDCLDHVSVHSGSARERLFAGWEREIAERADVVACVSRNLAEAVRRAVPGARNLKVIPNGVCSSWLGETPAPIGRELLGGSNDRRVAGFLGAVFEWVDVELLAATAREMPDWSFAVVGPQRRGVSVRPLRGLPNVKLFGAVPFADVPKWVGAFDVCLIPFKRNLVTQLADPIKLYEYCALGKPVVSSVPVDHPTMVPPVSVVDGPKAMAAAIRSAGDGVEAGVGSREERIGFAREQTWEQRADEMLSALASARSRRAG